MLAFATLLAGCATPLETAGLSWREGWRDVLVTQVGKAEAMPRKAMKDCRVGLAPELLASTSFARVTYRVSRRFERSVITPISPGSKLALGDHAFVNLNTCTLKPQPQRN
jgi:hypothetical protein